MYTDRERTQLSTGTENTPKHVVAYPASPDVLEEHLPSLPWLGRLATGIEGSSRALTVTLPDGRHFGCGKGPVVAQVHAKNSRAVSALGSLDEGKIAEAYIAGDLDITGSFLELMDLRSVLSDRHYLRWAWRFLEPMLFGQIKTNSRAISVHYDLDPGFYLSFLDETRCYTQGIFWNDHEPLHAAIRRKFDYCIESCGLSAGSHILEVGPGWGAFSEYAAERGIRVTAVTNSLQSKKFVDGLRQRESHGRQVHVNDFLDYRPTERFDAIVLMGIMEHLPQYDAVIRRFCDALKPGGFVYLDASATRTKYHVPSFIYRNIYPANHSFFVLHDFLRAVSCSPLCVREIFNDSHSYFLTFQHWAKRFESQRERVVALFGERNFRRFHLYLWGSTHCFLTDRLQCYRLVLQQPRV
jgi:cyclopropane-fatty-acyl-phospholipid synthase